MEWTGIGEELKPSVSSSRLGTALGYRPGPEKPGTGAAGLGAEKASSLSGT